MAKTGDRNRETGRTQNQYSSLLSYKPLLVRQKSARETRVSFCKGTVPFYVPVNPLTLINLNARTINPDREMIAVASQNQNIKKTK
jgi:hypothetical protein